MTNVKTSANAESDKGLVAALDELTKVATDYGRQRAPGADAPRLAAIAVTALLSAAVRLCYAHGGGIDVLVAALRMVWNSVRVTTYTAPGADTAGRTPSTNSSGGAA